MTNEGSGAEPQEKGEALAAVEVERTEIVVVTEAETPTGEEVVILEIVDIEEYVIAGKPVPRAKKYRFRVNKKHCVSDKEEVTGAEILTLAEFLPVTEFRLRKKRRHGPPEEIKLDETVHLRLHEIERFIAQGKHVDDGRGGRQEFALSDEDGVFLDSLGLEWETLRVPNPKGGQPRLWVVIYGMAIPKGFNVEIADVAIEIAAGYPTAQLDMAYFNPPLSLHSRRPISRVEAVEKIDKKDWQRWSRHRKGPTAWRPGEDNLETHFAFVQDWLVRELEK